MTQSVSLAAMIPVMLPEDLKDNFFFSSTQMLQIFFLQLRHMDIIMSGDNLYPTLCYHSVTLDLDFNLETNISGFDWYILIIRDFFLFHVFYSILLFFFLLQRSQWQLCFMRAIKYYMQVYQYNYYSDQGPLRWETGHVQQDVFDCLSIPSGSLRCLAKDWLPWPSTCSINQYQGLHLPEL